MNNYMKTIISGLKQWVSSQKSDWNQNDSSAANFIKNRPFYSEEKEKVLFSGNVETVDDSGLYGTILSYVPYEIGQEYKVIFAGTAYICKAFNNVNVWSGQAVLLGNLGMLNAATGLKAEDTGEPFFFMSLPEEMTNICTQTAGTYDVSISGTVEEVHQIDKKYVPMPDLADVAHTGNYWDLVDTPYIPWDTVQYATSQSLPDSNKKTARNNIGAASATDVSNLNTQIENVTNKCITGMSVSGKVITYTKGNGSTGTITTQDTTYSNATTSAAGLMSAADKTKLNGLVVINNLKDGKTSGSLRSNSAIEEDASYSLGIGAISLGIDSKASGFSSHAEGCATTASGGNSHAEGSGTEASGENSHAEGYHTTAAGQYSHAEGAWTVASSKFQHVQGKNNIKDSANKYAHIVGNGNSEIARSNAHTLDWNGVGWFKGGLKVGGTSQDDSNAIVTNLVDGSQIGSLRSINSTAESSSYSLGQNAFAVGLSTKAFGHSSHAEGESTLAAGNKSHAEGYNTTASSLASHAEGYNTKASGERSHAEGDSTIASGAQSHAEGAGTRASGLCSHTEGQATRASGSYSHAEGEHVVASGDYSHAEGKGATTSIKLTGEVDSNSYQVSVWNNNIKADNIIVCQNSVAKIVSINEANNEITLDKTLSDVALSDVSVTMYYGGFASGNYSHAEGYSTIASGNSSHAEGYRTIASSTDSHAEGQDTVASEDASHAEGNKTIASGYASHAEGNGTIASSMSQHVQGRFNIENSNNKYAHIVGNGISDTSRSNAHTLDWNGNAWFAGDIYVGGTSQNDATAVKVAIVPFPTAADEGKILRVVNGAPTWVDLSSVSNG